jgi:hypothetical protein
LLKRTLERRRQCFNNILEGKGEGEVAMEECDFTYLVSLKCEERSHYNSNCLLCQRCRLLCTSYGECTAAGTCVDLKGGAPPEFFSFYSENSYISKEYSFT